MSPDQLAELLALHPAQQAAYQELILWGNAGGEGLQPSFSAVENALKWAKQTPIPTPEPEKDKAPEENNE